MLFALSLLIPLLGFFFWLFWRMTPKRRDSRSVRWFNFAAMAVALVATLVITYLVRARMAAAPDHVWWPIVASFYVLVLAPLLLLAAGALRQAWFPPDTPAAPLPDEAPRDLSKTRF